MEKTFIITINSNENFTARDLSDCIWNGDKKINSLSINKKDKNFITQEVNICYDEEGAYLEKYEALTEFKDKLDKL